MFADNRHGGAEVCGGSAGRAMEWGEGKVAEGDYEKDHGYTPGGSDELRTRAAAELYRLTGAGKWHDIFGGTTFLDEENSPISRYGGTETFFMNSASATKTKL